ncbi:MAG: oligosaccharide flippase family protein, partial [Dehalococcoidia bacterium]|nr:oligosaccharide flippase family protein [Dehalococcoidia bacterium]
AFIFMLTLAVVLFGAGVGIAWHFNQIFKIAPGLEKAAAATMVLLAIVTSISTAFSVLDAIFVATQQYVWKNYISIGVTLIRALLVVVLLYFFRPWVVWVALAELIATVISVTAKLVIARKIMPFLRFNPFLFDLKTGLQVLGFSGAVFLGQVSGILYWHTDRILINEFLSARELTFYAVVTMFGNQIYHLFQVPTSVLFPVIASAEATGRLNYIESFIYRWLRLSIIFAIPIWALFGLLGGKFFRWYLGPRVADQSHFIPIVAITLLFSSVTCIIRLTPLAIGRVLFVNIMELIGALVNIGLSLLFVLLLGWGLSGVALGTVIVVVFKNLFVIPCYLSAIKLIKFSSFFITIWRGFVSSLCLVGAPTIFWTILQGYSYILAGTLSFLGLLVGVFLLWKFAFNIDERLFMIHVYREFRASGFLGLVRIIKTNMSMI